MSEIDKVFQFIEGLKSWARSKLYEQNIGDLSMAYTTVERVFDLSNEQSQDAKRSQTFFSGGTRNHVSNPPRIGERVDWELEGENKDNPNKGLES